MRKSDAGMIARPSVGKRIRKSLPYYALIALPLVYLLVFRYYPMLGVQIAFKNYKAKLGIWGSPWVGLKYFRDFFGSATAGSIILNTFLLSLYYLVASFPFPIILAIALNECRSQKFKKVTQMVTYMPYFISTVVLVGMMMQLMSPVYGLYGSLRQPDHREAGRQAGELHGHDELLPLAVRVDGRLAEHGLFRHRLPGRADRRAPGAV